jgi:hypothetical protein
VSQAPAAFMRRRELLSYRYVTYPLSSLYMGKPLEHTQSLRIYKPLSYMQCRVLQPR